MAKRKKVILFSRLKRFLRLTTQDTQRFDQKLIIIIKPDINSVYPYALLILTRIPFKFCSFSLYIFLH